ncbi:hypothetical protein K2173_028570 [Erythroxylum novogranatense]|uniref:Uncharacterized protein n=1 Tax=Erythroxylum novogranatense TaxID=1862640 RepID=A0AAV8U533_9ROSI|nr:hypothetical protein K2173_028570 [Erythroxylum novogranatense]
MSCCVLHFKEQADSLAFEGVRRLIQKDLGLEQYALDVHKRYIKQCLFECLNGTSGDDTSKNSGEAGEKQVSSVRGKLAESPGGLESNNNVKDIYSEGQKVTKPKIEETEEVPSESSIEKALLKMACYIQANSESITLAGLLWLLEEDLKLDKYALDPFEKVISNQLYEVLKSSEASEPKNTTSKKVSHSKESKMFSDNSSESLDTEADSDVEDKGKRKRKLVSEKMLPNKFLRIEKDAKRKSRPLLRNGSSQKKLDLKAIVMQRTV